MIVWFDSIIVRIVLISSFGSTGRLLGIVLASYAIFVYSTSVKEAIVSAERFEDSLPASIQMMMDIEDSELGDYSEALRAQTILARIATRRALKAAAAEEWSKAEIVQMGDTTEVPESTELVGEKATNKRLELAANLNRSVVEIKTKRHEAKERFAEKAEDKPKPANIVFTRAETSPRHMILRYLRLNRVRDAKIVAKDNNLDWREFAPHVNQAYAHESEVETA